MVEADYSSIGTAATGFSASAGRLRDADVAGPLSSVQDALVGDAGDDDPVLLGLFSGPDGCWVTRARRGTPPVTVPSAAAAARGAVRDLVEDAFAQVTIRGL